MAINDNGNTGTGGGADQALGTVNVDITAVNDEEVLATNVGATVAEASTDNVISSTQLQTTDLDNTDAELVYTVTAVPGNGTLRLNGAALENNNTFTQADIDAGFVTYDHDGSETTADAFNFTVDDGAGSTTPGTFNFTVTAVNDAPVAANIETADLAYTENDGAVEITNTITFSDVDDTELLTATIQITDGFVGTEDALLFTEQNGITGAFSGGGATLTLTGPATLAEFEAAIRSVTYTNDSEAPNTGTRTVSITVNDGSLDSNPQTRDIAIEAVNDAATVSLENTTTTLAEDTATSPRVKVADIVITDDGLGTNDLTLSGADAALFEIDGNELFLTDGASLDFETKPSLDVIVVVDDAGVGATPDDTVALSIAITDANDPIMITSDGGGATATVEAPENQLAVTTVVAVDPDGDTPIYQITGGVDAGWFDLDSATGALTFKTDPDFESPADADGDNIYEVTVEAADTGGLPDVQSIFVQVTDEIDTVTGFDPSENPTPGPGGTETETETGPDPDSSPEDPGPTFDEPSESPEPEGPVTEPLDPIAVEPETTPTEPAEPSNEPTPDTSEPAAEEAAVSDPAPAAPTTEPAEPTTAAETTPAAAVSPGTSSGTTPSRNGATPAAFERTPEYRQSTAEEVVKEVERVERVSQVETYFTEETEAVEQTVAVKRQLVVRVGSATAGALSVGYVALALRGGSLLAALATSLPTWAMLDPVAILPKAKKRSWWRRRKSLPISNKGADEALFD